ncbi:MAG: tetratricopeptide repeat protein [Nitrospirota bacterium]
MRTEMSDRYKVMFIIFVSLGIYYPSIFGGVNSVDDYQLITTLINTDHISLREIFFPMGPVYYYRPILSLSFISDRLIFNCSEFYMHLNNIILHTINGVLIFFIVREILRIFKVSNSHYIPMFASLLFIVHPINTESVNWISGRTDVLAGLFVFLSFLVFIKKGLENHIWCWISAIFYLMGLLTKETAIGFILVIGLFLFLKENAIKDISIKKKIALFFPFLIMTITYFFMRTITSNNPDTGIIKAAQAFGNDTLFIHIGSIIKAFGFYIKKVFVPLPLNFGIIEINRTFYFWFGIISLGFTLYLLFVKRTLLSFLLFFSVAFFLPSLPVATAKMAWTPLAERYLYISSFGVSLLIIFSFFRLFARENLRYGILALLLFVASLITVNRNIIWQDNLTLYKDTIEKSPNFAVARNEYGIALFINGKPDEALEQFKIAEKLAGETKYKDLLSVNITGLFSDQMKPEEAKEQYLKLLEKTPLRPISLKALQNLIKIAETQLKKESDSNKKEALYREILSYFRQIYELERDSFYLYRIGQYHLALGEKEKAIESFKEAVKLSPDEYYSEPARKLVRKLESENSD